MKIQRFAGGLCTWLALALFSSGCSETEFTDGDSKEPTVQHNDLEQSPPAEEPVVPQEPVEPIVIQPVQEERTPAHFNLAWIWPCDGDGSEQVLRDSLADDVVVLEPGGHSIDLQAGDTASLAVVGSYCEPDALARDIVIALDVSGSMATSDPIDPDTGECARSEAISRIIDNFNYPELVRIGLVTYGTAVMNQSTELLTPEDFKNSAINSPAVLCDNLGGGTYYRAGLQVAENLFASYARADSQREVYFLSDGSPNPGQEGYDEAGRLKNDYGATIATVMLAPDDYDDSVLRALASLGLGNDPLHERTGDAGRMSTILSELALPKIVDAQLSVRGVGSAEWGDVDLLEHSEALIYSYGLELFTLPDFPQGLEIEIRYADQKGGASLATGSLLWSE